jgi:hypothetical protein
MAEHPTLPLAQRLYPRTSNAVRKTHVSQPDGNEENLEAVQVPVSQPTDRAADTFHAAAAASAAL